VRTKADRNQTMMTAVDIMNQAHPWAADLVRYEEQRIGSRMTAYERVASTIGVSASWLRKLIGRQSVELAAHEYLNIALAYRKLCERIEAEAENNRRRAVAAMESINATLASASIVVADETREDSSGTSGEVGEG
jgi:hypothetical protein